MHVASVGIGYTNRANSENVGVWGIVLSQFFLSGLGTVGNSIFFLISGFFAASKGCISLKRQYKVITPVIFYTSVFILLAAIFGYLQNYTLILSSPLATIGYFIFGGDLWFPIGFILVNVMFKPFVRKILKQRFIFDIIIASVLASIPLIYYICDFCTKGLMTAFFEISVMWILKFALPYFCVFFLGIIVFKYRVQLWSVKLRNVGIVAGLGLILHIISLIFMNVDIFADVFLSFDNFSFCLIALSMFIYFSNINIKSNRLSSFALWGGKCAFGIYILHGCGFSPISMLFTDWLIPALKPYPALYFFFFIGALCVFALCFGIEFIRLKVLEIIYRLCPSRKYSKYAK
jgi:hypothetical protein